MTNGGNDSDHSAGTSPLLKKKETVAPMKKHENPEKVV